MSLVRLKNKKVLFCLQQFLHVGLFSYFLAFLPLYLKSISFDAEGIVLVSFISTLILMCANYITVEYLKKIFERKTLLHVMNFLAILSFCAFLSVSSRSSILIFWTLHIFSRVSSGVIVDTELVKHRSIGEMSYEHLRLWGSIGFIIAGSILGLLFKEFGAVVGSWSVVLFLIALFGICIVAFQGVENELKEENTKPTFDVFSLPKQIYLLFLVVCLSWASHAPLYTYYSLYLEECGYSSNAISFLWSIGVVSEIVMFFFYGALNKKLSHLTILKLSVVLTIGRWLMLAYSSDFYILLAAQVFHAFSYGSIFLASIKISYEMFPERIKDKSQGYLGVLGVGLGSLLGRFMLSTPLFNISHYMEVPRLFIYMIAIALASCVFAFTLKSSRE